MLGRAGRLRLDKIRLDDGRVGRDDGSCSFGFLWERAKKRPDDQYMTSGKGRSTGTYCSAEIAQVGEDLGKLEALHGG